MKLIPHIGIHKESGTVLELYIYVTGKMDVLGKTVLPRQNGFAYNILLNQANPISVLDR